MGEEVAVEPGSLGLATPPPAPMKKVKGSMVFSDFQYLPSAPGSGIAERISKWVLNILLHGPMLNIL